MIAPASTSRVADDPPSSTKAAEKIGFSIMACQDPLGAWHSSPQSVHTHAKPTYIPQIDLLGRSAEYSAATTPIKAHTAARPAEWASVTRFRPR